MIELGDELVRHLEEAGSLRRLRRGERLIFEGVRHGAVLLITAGTLRIVSCSKDGDEVVIAIRGPGELVGHLSPLAEGDAGASVIAREDGEVIVINSARFMEVVHGHADHVYALLSTVITMFNDAERRRVGWITRPIADRVLDELIRLAESNAFEGRALTVTQAEVANLCGASRSSVSSVLGRLRDDGILTTERGRITVTDLDALRSVDPVSLGGSPAG